jgi:hypothetical protein
VLVGLYELVAPHLTEEQRRLLAGAAARALGRGGGARMTRGDPESPLRWTLQVHPRAG